MPRKTRFQLPGVSRHAVRQGNRREACLCAAADYRCCLDAMRDVTGKFGGHVHACVLMTNHVRLVITPDRKDALSLIMKSVGRRYVRCIKKEYRRSGPLRAGRFKASPVPGEWHLLPVTGISSSIRSGPAWLDIPRSPDGRAARPIRGQLPMRSSRRMMSIVDRVGQRQKGRLLVASYSDPTSFLAYR